MVWNQWGTVTGCMVNGRFGASTATTGTSATRATTSRRPRPPTIVMPSGARPRVRDRLVTIRADGRATPVCPTASDRR